MLGIRIQDSRRRRNYRAMAATRLFTDFARSLCFVQNKSTNLLPDEISHQNPVGLREPQKYIICLPSREI